ncbi:unnamed protein product [Angiostrongylus costaricensis]|uniref:Zf-C3Hc3H domain-containing protein n=1 Tax=Angiostrongylus costaricensis TaxID=334426 RepID=A0A158PHP4_ANGCS|nr:unnamed protein product [Angiostrongylus costaricensis]
MGDVIDWGASEPPNRYVLAFGTSHCLVEQDYDRSIYGECEYIGSRTLIKCKAVRKKADLKANGGICEMHKSFHDSIRNRFLCEDRRLMQENGQGKLKYSPFLNQDGLICEEHPWLMPSYRWESPLNRSIFDHAPDDDSLAPLWNARVYTERDLLRLRKILSEKRVEYLRLHAEMIVERARRRASDLFSKNGKLLTVGDTSAAVVAACSSIDDYGVISKRIVASQKAQGKRSHDQRRLCSFGKLRKISTENNDHVTISSIIHSILDCIADEKIDFISYGKVQNSKESTDNTPGVGSENVPQCLEPAVPLTMFCISHQMLDESQLLFVPCSSCHSMCADIRSPPLCGKHLRDIGRAKRASLRDGRMPISPAVNVSTGVPTTSTSSKIKAFNDPSKPLFGLPSSPSSAPFLSTSLADKRGHKRVSVDVQTKEEAEEIFKRFRLEAPAQLSLTEAINQRQAPAVLEAIRRAELRRNREEACSCSRIRPFERTQFPPKSSVPRRINTISRPAVSVRRPFPIEGAPLQSPEVLIEDRRTPPSSQNTQGNNTTKEYTGRPTAPPHSRRLISSYRRQIAGAILRHPLSIQHVGEDTSHGDVPRAHSVLPPPPDPPILPLSYDLYVLEYGNKNFHYSST